MKNANAMNMIETINLTQILNNYGFGAVVSVMPTVTKAEDVDPVYAPEEPTFRRHTKAEEIDLGKDAEKRHKMAKSFKLNRAKKALEEESKYDDDFEIKDFEVTKTRRISAIRTDSVGTRRREAAVADAMAEYRRKGVR